MALISEWPSIRNCFPFEMAFHSEWLRNNPKGPPGPIPPKGAEGALGSPLGSHLMPLGPIVPVSRDDNVATRVIGGGAGIARAYKQGRRAARSVYGLYFELEMRPAWGLFVASNCILGWKSVPQGSFLADKIVF